MDEIERRLRALEQRGAEWQRFAEMVVADKTADVASTEAMAGAVMAITPVLAEVCMVLGVDPELARTWTKAVMEKRSLDEAVAATERVMLSLALARAKPAGRS